MFSLFSIGHFILLAVVICYTVGLCFLLRKRTKRTQIIVLGILSLTGVVLFATRWRLLFEMWLNGRELTSGEFGGLLPFELCNIGVFVLPFTVFFRKRFLVVFSFYVNLLGAALAFMVLPNNIQALNLWDWQFVDYFVCHANLVAIPFTIISCGWYKLKMKDTVFAAVLFFLMFAIMLPVNLLLKAVNWAGDHTNYLFVMGPKGFPVISQLWSIIPVPLLYILPLAPIFWAYGILVTLPFTKKGERKQQFKEMIKGMKYLGFKDGIELNDES